MIRHTMTAAAVSLAVAAGAGAASAQDSVRWRVASAFPTTMSHLGTSGPEFVEMLKRISGGNIDLRLYEPNALVPPLGIFDAVAAGSVNAGWTSAGYHVGKFPEVVMFSSFPFGPGPAEYLAWMKHGGGIELYQELYAKHNVMVMPCLLISPEAGGWFNKEINSVEDLRGLKMRFAGYGGKVMERVGVSTQLLAPGDIYQALDLGAIDAAELSMPAIDLSAGFEEVAEYYYFPGWQQQTTFHEFIINMDLWNGLSDQQQAQIETACDAQLTRSLAHAGYLNMQAMAGLRERGTVEIREYPDEVIEHLREAWHALLDEEVESNPEFARIWQSYQDFRETYDAWNSIAHVE
jgi:TRAP-type mannitol/chloroaromatic compound transport system substrate-binding protein